MRAFGLWYGVILLMIFIGVSVMVPRSVGLQEDVISNFYGSFQNELFAKSLYELAAQCIKQKEKASCLEDGLDFEGFEGSYQISEKADVYDVEIIVLHKNPRNFHIMRYFTHKIIKKEGSNAKNP
ncbi:hypothetical protein [Helicobacter mustelae]|uniref:Uncharacterized protein n=1 Tax=Helicobacter mustelae (strain ATCC 43772 / CCUG 25715 / CIP 103759 / LMG 18044 / NCTC 12198 / R85-136P) TaxID=679897 RepID=D3UIR2_HELM1|nr:hypothetical protein [Helicobacter mustelae]CBG40387.1 Putative hypothetical protein [Helicobacter mustelae 12198]SQH71886.1 Uncharacterised protein [Helicobacter mustelae]STP13026.1 Uncharacterised protein [Helicobacter mustelae]